jgi:threonine aldolase
VGSLVCGSAERIHAVHRARKLLGGAMRQAGILAAAGIHALEHHVERLAEDHVHARLLADGLEGLDYPLLARPETNMVFFRVEDTLGFLDATRSRGVLINPMADGIFRAVTHLDVSRQDVADALGALAEIRAAGIR